CPDAERRRGHLLWQQLFERGRGGCASEAIPGAMDGMHPEVKGSGRRARGILDKRSAPHTNVCGAQGIASAFRLKAPERPIVYTKLGFGGSANRANAGAGTAGNAGIRIDDVLAITLADCADRALFRARTA